MITLDTDADTDTADEPTDPGMPAGEQVTRAISRLLGIVGRRMPLLDMIRVTEEHFNGVIRSRDAELQRLRDLLHVEMGHAGIAPDTWLRSLGGWRRRDSLLEIMAVKENRRGVTAWYLVSHLDDETIPQSQPWLDCIPQIQQWLESGRRWGYALDAMRSVEEAIRQHKEAECSTSSSSS